MTTRQDQVLQQDKVDSPLNATEQAAHVATVGVGAVCGGATGAVIGAVAGPVGVASGAVAGAVAGALAGEVAAETIAELFEEPSPSSHDRQSVGDS